LKEKIIQKAQYLFVSFGFKTELVDATANNLHEQLVAGISSIREKSDDPIKEFFEVKDLVMEHLHLLYALMMAELRY